MQFSFLVSTVATALLAAASVRAESHTITFNNLCGYGTPTLIQGPNTLHTGGGTYTINGPLTGAIAYLQNNGQCGFNGENCLIFETTLKNPPSPGAGSSTDMSLISPHAYQQEASFEYYNGCDGQGLDCDSSNCYYAFHTPTDYWAQVQCEVDNVDLKLTWCGNDS